MSAWIVITKELLSASLNEIQLSALQSIALGEGQADPVVELMQDRCNYIRNRISSRVQLSATEYAVPPELKTDACMLIVEALTVRLSIGMELTEDQVRMINRAYSDLDIAGTDDFPISTPDDPVSAEVQTQGGIRVVSKRTRDATGSSMAGL
jgi:hypothetical protein